VARDWKRIRDMIRESCRLIAPERSVAKLDGAAPQPSRRTRTKRAR
jgi:hypothetical protein